MRKSKHNPVRYCLLGLILLLHPGPHAKAAKLEIYPEFLRPDPFGGVVRADHAAHPQDSQPGARRGPITFEGARGGYVSFHLVAQVPPGQNYSLNLQFLPASSALEADVFREWFHFLIADKSYYPDALIPVKLPYVSRLPEPDNRIEGQIVQAFWVDIWIPPSAAPGTYRAHTTLQTASERVVVPVQLKVMSAVIPARDVVTVDHNSYGSSWLATQYPKAANRVSDFYASEEFFQLIHAYHRIFYEHRGVYHQLGYGHGGKVGPEFAPVLEGSGRQRHVSNWDLYDRHYGPLFDGSAFAGSRRGARPIPFVYLPINPEWPASFLWWGDPGYEAEFVNVVSEMERHFRDKEWTNTRFELFFNHKKRYKGFPWDGDEVRFPKDNQYFIEYSRLLKKALPQETPVAFVFRADVSWDMEQQFKDLKGIVNLWVCSESILSWYKDAPRMLRDRGDIVWYDGGPPSVNEASAAITKFPLQAWLWGVDGFVHWQTVDPGDDPWFHFEGGSTALVYSGDHFGLSKPIPSIRLKLERDSLQDLALLDSFKDRRSLTLLKAEAARRYNGSTLDDWWNPRPAIAALLPEEWTNTAIDVAASGTQRRLKAIGPDAWANIHEFVIQLVSEAQ